MSITTAGRTLSADMVTEVTTVQLAPVILVSLSFPSAYTRLWTGYGTLTYAGVPYLGIGTFGSISPIEETTDLAARGISMRLSGVPTANIALLTAVFLAADGEKYGARDTYQAIAEDAQLQAMLNTLEAQL